MTEFSDLGLSADALKAVAKLGYTEPSPVQAQAIPVVLTGRDLIAAASTGTGKTAAFLLPTLSKLARAGRGKRAPRVLVITPTRELASQIASTCIKISRATGHYTTTVYGGTKYGPQIRELRGGTDVLIATPGRLCDLMKRGVVDLSAIEVLVLDEADRMLDMGFLPDVTTIVDALPTERQTLLFSATIDEGIRKNLGNLLDNPEIIQIAKKGETAKSVDHYIMPVKHKEKPELLKCVLEELGHNKVIVFARTKVRAEEVAELLNDAGFESECIHSDRSQGQRRKALSRFRSGKVGIIVATDVLARGIDVPEVDYVVNFDLPDMAEDYVHRIGRTGRGGQRGFAVSFASPNSMKSLRAIEALIKQEIPVKTLESYNIDETLLKRGEGVTGTRAGRGRKFKGAEGGRRRASENAEYTGKNRKKKQAHSDSRAANFKSGNVHRQHKNAGAQKEVEYNYEGWGDLRQGSKKKSSKWANEDGGTPARSQKRSHMHTKAARGGMKPGQKSSGLRAGSKKSGAANGKGAGGANKRKNTHSKKQQRKSR
jgi:ATP-dependent RNA helicase RhlE